MGFFKQEYWSGLSCPFSGTEPGSPASQADSLPSETLRESATYENSMEKPILHLDAQQWFLFFNEHQSHRELVKKNRFPDLFFVCGGEGGLIFLQALPVRLTLEGYEPQG